MSQLIINSSYGFFDNETIQETKKFFDKFLNSTRMSEYINSFNDKTLHLTGQALSINNKELNALLGLNNIEGLNVVFSKNNSVNMVYGFLPEFKKIIKPDNEKTFAQTFNEKNKGKVYKVIIPKGTTEYVIADASIRYNSKNDNFFIKSLTPNKSSFLVPDANNRLRSNGKINELIYSKGSDGVIHISNADYEEIVNRLYRYNVGVLRGTSFFDDGELIDIISNAASQTQSPNKIVNLLTAFQAQGSFGIKQKSYRNQNSTIGYMSGVELSDMLNTDKINKDYTYKMEFGLDSSNDILGITALDENGNEVKNFVNSKEYELITGEESSAFFKKDRVMTKIGYFNSRLSDAMIDYNDNGHPYINKYNNQIKKEFKNNKQISRQRSYEIAKEVVLDYQAKTLDRYGFNTQFDNSDKAKYVKSFFNYYESLSDNEQSGHLAEFYNRVKYNLDVGTIAGNIYEGRLLDNLMTIAKQSKNTLDTRQYVSQALLNPLFAENVQGQRKAQALDRLPELVLNNRGRQYNVADITKTFYSNIREMNYKKTQFEYLQRNGIIKKLGKAAGIEENNLPNVSNSMIRVLYAESDLAFQDSSIYTNSSAMQIPAMFDNKKDFSVSYNALKRDVYGNITNEQLENFYNELRLKKYNISSLSGENKVIANTMLQNLLGEENYNRYVIERKQDIINELKDVGSPLSKIPQIEGNEIEYIKASNEATGKFNSWLNKFFIKSDANSTINILNPDMVNSSISTTISGSNYANFDNIEFTENGIKLGINRVFIQGHGSKVMNDHIKSTTQMLTNLLGAQFEDGSRMFFEGIINEKYTKAKRGFTGTQFARILTTAAYNAINADYKDGNVISTADKFNLFKSYMTNTHIPTKNGPNNGMRNIFEILNIDMRYENGKIIFDDKNVQKAIDAFNFNEYESLDAIIIDNLRKHRKEIFGRDLVNDEGRILGVYAQELMAYAYSDLSKEMTENSRNRFRLYEENFDLLKDYVTDEEISLSNLGKIKRGWFLLSNNAMMMETKKRKTEEGLKLGRLSALTLTELGMDNVVNYIKEKAISNKNVRQVADYISLAAPVGTEFARGAEAIGEVKANYYTQAFKNQNQINIATDVDIYKSLALNDNINNFLTNSPIGKLMDYDINEGRLKTNTQGIITGFSQGYMDSLKSFFSIENRQNVHNELADFAGYSILNSNLYTYDQSFTNNAEYTNKLKEFKKLILGEQGKKARRAAFLNTISEMFALDQNAYDKLIKEKQFFDIGEFFYDIYNDKLQEQISSIKGVDKKLVNNFFEFSLKNKTTSSRSVNLFKTMASIATMYDQSFGEAGNTMFDGFDKLTKAKLEQRLYNFNLNKNDLFSLNIYINESFKDDDNTGKILKGFFRNFDSIKDNNIYNILELQQISEFGDIPFLIDSMSVDQNGNMVPNAELSKYGKIIQTAKEIENLEKEKKDLEFLFGKKLDVDSDEFKKSLEEANARRNNIFNNFLKTLTDPEQIADAKEEIENVNKIFKNGDINLSNLSATTFYNILSHNTYISDYYENGKLVENKSKILTNFVNNEISEKLFKFKQYSDKNNNYNSNIRKAFNNYGLIKSLDDIVITPDMSFEGIKLSDVQKQILNKSFFGESKNRFSIENFDREVRVAKNNIKKINEADNYLEDVYSIERFIKGIIGTEFKNQVGIGAIEYEDYLKAIENGISYEKFIDLTSEITGAKVTNKKFALLNPTREFVLKQQTKLSSDINREMIQKQSMLTNLLMTRLNGLYERISAKGGALYEMSTIADKASSAFSPREASAMTMFMKQEMKDIMSQQRRIMSQDKSFLSTDIGKEVLSKYKKTKKDFEKAMKLVYGEEIINDALFNFDERLGKIHEVDDEEWIEWLEDSTEEIKKKLDNFSHIILGTDEDWKNAGRFHLFDNNGKLNKVYYGLLSRNPHQYKLSVSPSRMVRLNDADINLSFIGKYLGSGNKVQSSQSSLMMLGKLTALGAKGDFDGDTFQILSLGLRSLDINKIRGMNAKQFAREFDNKSQLFHLMNNMAGEDLRTAFYGDNLNNSQKSLKRLISQVYFNGKDVSSSEAYDAIEDVYLSLSHEKARILKTLTEEIGDHSNVSKFKGFYDVGNKKVSKKAVGAFLLTVDDKTRNRYLQGKYDSKNLLYMLENNNKLTALEKQELINAFNVDNGKSLLNAFETIREDKEVPLFQTIYEYVNNYLAYTGIAKTGEVHDKLTNYREVIDTLIDHVTMENLRNNLKIKETANIFNSQTLYNATMGHEIGDLIESLAISSKKGNTSPDLVLQSLNSGEKIMRKYNLNFNADIIADYNKKIETEALSETFDTINSIKNKTFNDFFSGLYLNTDEFINTLDKDGGHTNKKIFSDLMRAFLNISSGKNEKEIEAILDNRNKITIDDIYGESILKDPRKFVSIISTWSSPMIVGNLERLADVDNLNRVDHNTIFSSSIKSAFKVATNLLDLIKIGDKGIGTRLNAAVIRHMNKKFDLITKAKLKRSELEDVIDNKFAEASNEEIRDEITETGKKVIDNLESQTTEAVINKSNVNQSNFNPPKTTQMSFDFDNLSTEDIKNIPNNAETQKLTDDIKNEIDMLKKEIQDLKSSGSKKDKQIQDLNNIIDTQHIEINDLKSKNEFYQKQDKSLNDNANVIKRVMDNSKKIVTSKVEKAKQYANSDLANAAKKQISDHKKGLAIFGGVAILASFFRIFQSNRPVVNLDINEQEYERSQGSLYRNLGQYTMNTNIRSLY